MKRFCIIFFAVLYSFCLYVQAQGLVINEIQVANVDQYIDPSCNYGSWIELYNQSSDEIILKDVKVKHTDSDGIAEQQTLTTEHGSIPAGGYKIIWFDHNSTDGNKYDGALGAYTYTDEKGWSVEIGHSINQMNFKLDADGGKIEILNADGTTADSYSYSSEICVARCSWARTTDGGDSWSMTAYPTPGESNANSTEFASDRLDAPTVDIDGGLFDAGNSVTCEVTIPTGQTLKYTTDGSAPSVTNGIISDNGVFTVDTTTVFRFALFEDGYLPSAVVTRSFIRKDHDYYLPILSIVTENKNLYDDVVGSYVKGKNGVIEGGLSYPTNLYMDWERPVNMEYLIPSSTSLNGYISVLNQESDFQLSGGWSRRRTNSSFRLKGDKRYEWINSFDYPYLESKKYNKYKTFQLRNGGNDYIARIIDASLQETIRRSGFYLDVQAWQPCQLFINGKFIRMFNIREASNKHFGYSNYGIDTDFIDQFEGNFEPRVGTDEIYNQLLEESNKLANNPSDINVWNNIQNLLDIDEYCNYMAAKCYIGNLDWISNNIKGFRSQLDDGKLHYVLYDVDNTSVTYTPITNLLSKRGQKQGKLFYNLQKYELFKQQFIDAFCLLAGSVFDKDNYKSVLDEMVNLTEESLSFEKCSAKSTANQIYNIITSDEHVADRLNDLAENFEQDDKYHLNIYSNIKDSKLLLNGQEIPTNKFDGSLFGTITLTAKAPAGYTFLGWRMNTHTGSLKADAPAKVGSLRKSSEKGNSDEASGTTESYDGNSEIGIFDEIASTSETYTLTDEYEAGTFVLEAVYHKITDDEARLASGATPIRINEVSAGNDIYINDYFKKNDWVELYNTTDEAIDVAGMYLSDDRSNPRKYRIQAMTTDPSSLPTPQTTVIPAHGTRIIWCDGLTQQNQLHAPFKLSNADGAVVSIMASDGSWQDVMEYKYQPRFCTYGRYPDGGNYACLMSRPTIDAANSILTQDFRAATEKEWASPDIVVTLGLFKGWNWTSHNMADPVQASLFMSNALCIRDQKDETIKDEVFGWVGNITTLKPAVGYKIKMEENTAITIRGNIFDKANTPVTVLKGWNWIGMPLYSPCMLTSFFCNYEATEGDWIQGQEGFATYSAGAWSGSLTELTPGQAYLLKAGKAQQFNWPPVKDGNGTTESYSGETDMKWDNTVTTFSATTESSGGSSNLPTDDKQQMTEQYASSNMDWGTSEKTSRKETNRRYMCPLAASASAGLWTCDIHAYPNVMSLIGELKVDGNIVSYGYTVAAFCDDECRGVAEVTDGKIYMNLHGDGGEGLTFKVCDNIGEQYPLDNAMTFTAQTLVGSMSEPYLFSLSTVTELSDADAMTIVNVEYFTLDGIRISAPGNGIYIKRITYKDGHVENIKTM